MAEKNEKFLIGKILKDERLRLGYTRDQVAERAEISVRYLVAIENDEKKPRIDVLRKIIWSLGMSADRIFYPTKPQDEDAEAIRLIRLLSSCDERDRKLVATMIETLVNSRENDDT